MTTYINQISSLGPKIWYRFNETAGTPVNSGSLSTTSTFNNLLLNEQTDVDGRAIYLNGSSSSIQLPAHPTFSLFNDRSFTVETWVKILNSDTNRTSPLEIFRLNAPSSPHYTVSLTVDGTSGARGKVKLSSTWTSTLTSTNAIDDGNWHHIVYTYNTSSVKLYIDGTLDVSTTPSNLIASFNFDESTKKLIGAGYTGTSQSTIGQYFKGRIDEFAAYDYELTSANILDNYNAGASVTFADTPGTASSLMVNPAWSVETVVPASVMTASAASGDHYNSTVTFPTLLETYMSTLSLQTWFKFDKFKTLTDYGTEATRSSTWSAGCTNNPVGGVQGSGELKLIYDGATVPVIVQQVALGTGVSALLSDEDFAIGFWTKKQTLPTSNSYLLSSYKSDNSNNVSLYWNTNGGISFNIYANNNNHTVSSSTDITDGEWHFVVAKLSSNTMQLWVDGTSIGTTTMNHNIALDYFQFDGSNSTDTTSMSQFFVATSSNIGTTEIANIYDYGTPSVVQASAYMPDPIIDFSSAFNNYIKSKNPVLDFHLDEPTGSPRNYGSAEISLVPFLSPQGFTQGEVALNTKAFKFTSRDQTTRGSYAFSTGTFSTDDVCTIGVLFKNANATNQQGLIGFGGRSTGVDGNGFSLQMLATSGYLRIVAGNGNGTATNYTGTTNYADNKWHLAIIVKSNSTVKLYVDGKEHISSSNSTQMTDTGEFIIAGIAGIIASAVTRDTLIDEAFVTNTAFTAQEAFEAWQALRLEMDTTATATLPMPTNIAGTGTTQTADAKTASSSLPMPVISTDQVPTIEPGTASALFVLPNFGGNVVIDANYGTEAMTASALFHDPQFQIGDGHSADHMNASALMVHPTAISAGSISVPTAVAFDATLVMPGIVTVKGARVFADPMGSNAIFPLPPAYITLSDDDWFVRLLEGHADRNTEFKQSTVASVPGQSATDIIQGGFLSFFDDTLADITQNTTPNYITSEIPAYYFEPIGDQQYDENGDLIALDTSKAVARVTPSRGVLNPTPMVSKGYFDNQERKAVRVENIEIPLPGTSTNFSIRPYNLEFSFKTTKANQVIAYGQYTSYTSTNSRKVGAIGLYNGKIYLAESFYTPVSAFGESGISSLRIAGTAPHPINFDDEVNSAYMLGNKRIDDGQWHHVIIQKGYTDGRTQIWIDGKLDKQLGVQSNDGRSSGYTTVPGSNGTSEVRPYIVGFNSADTNLYSDFQTSAWNFYPGRFLEERDVSLNYTAYGKWKPIKAEPMTATANITQNTKAAGNKGRALLLYWWPVTREFGSSESQVSNDNANFGTSDVPTFDKDLFTYDYENEIPQEYYGWDIFPISVTGYKGRDGGDPSEFLKPDVLISGGYYIDSVTSAPRYLDIVNDVDLSAFDAIFFRNFPDQSEELDAYIREQFSDQYFNLKERDLYNNFIQSLRAAVDAGVSLYVTNTQLALDLGIIDNYEIVPDFYEGENDPYAPTIIPEGNTVQNNFWIDVHRNNRLRVVNTLDGLTNEAGYIWKDWAYSAGNPEGFSGEPNRPFISLENRPNGLQAGDTFVISDATRQASYFEAVPFANVKAGKIITAFANTIRQGLTEVENPYKNYATCIAVEPGTILNGKPTAGKIFVNFTERLSPTTSAISGLSTGRPSAGARDTLGVDLIQDEWINIAYDAGDITSGDRDRLLAASYNLDRRLEAEIAGQNRPSVIAQIQQEKYWDTNGLNILTQSSTLEDLTGAGTQKDGLGKGTRKAIVNKLNKNGTLTTQSKSSSLQWFTFQYSWRYPRAQISVYSMLTRGFRWLSNKIVDEGLVNRVEAMTVATAELPMPVVTADKDRTVYAAAMLSNARIVHAPGYALADVTNTTLPLTAEAKFGDFVKNIAADTFNASAKAVQPRLSAIEEDEIVVYIYHVDPILYLREDVIK
jgi:hypothetical protein